MSNIVVPEAANWTEEETQRNLETLERMGLEDDVDTVKKLRANAKRRGDLSDDPSPKPAGDEGTSDKKGK